MALAELLQTIEADAAAEVREILGAAEKRAAEADARASHDRTDRVTRAGEEQREIAQAMADTRIADAQRDARARVLQARAQMLERVDAAARELLPSYTSRVAEALDAAATTAAGGQPGVKRIVATGTVIDLASGTTIVATLEALFEREAPRLSASLLAHLTKENHS